MGDTRDRRSPGRPDWAATLPHQCQCARDELASLAPWVSLPADSDGVRRRSDARTPTLREVADSSRSCSPDIARSLETARMRPSAVADRAARVGDGRQCASRDGDRSANGSRRKREFANVDYGFLYDRSRRLFAIGYNVTERPARLELLRPAGLRGAAVQLRRHRAGQAAAGELVRARAPAQRSPAASRCCCPWSGSMFEYLMPLLVMPTYDEHAARPDLSAAVASGRSSTAASAACPGACPSRATTTSTRTSTTSTARSACLGWDCKRGLADDLVVAPYATALALMVAPEAACSEPRSASPQRGLLGTFGFYEAIDYTPARLPRGQSHAIVRSYMAHHQGMSLLALAVPAARSADAAALRLRSARSRRPSCCCRSAFRRSPPSYPHARRGRRHRAEQPRPTTTPIRVIHDPDTPVPEVQLLSNGRYHVMVTDAGGGYSRWKDLAVTRWREDATRDNWGTFCYIRDVASGEFWSTAPPAHAATADQLRGDLLRGARRVSPPRSTDCRDAHRDRRSRRRTTSSCAASGIINRSRDARARRGDELRRSRAGAAGRGRAASGLQQAVRRRRRSSRASARSSARAGRAPATSSRPGCSTRWPSTARTTGELSYETDRARSSVAAARLPIPRARDACRSRAARARCSTRSWRSAADRPRARRDRHDRPGDRRRRHARARAEPDRQISGSAARRPGVRARVDAQPGRAAPARRHRGRRAALRSGSPARPLCQRRRCARTRSVDRAQPPWSVRSLGLRDLGRSADRAAADRRSRRTSSSCARCCRRTRTGGSRAWSSTW